MAFSRSSVVSQRPCLGDNTAGSCSSLEEFQKKSVTDGEECGDCWTGQALEGTLSTLWPLPTKAPRAAGRHHFSTLVLEGEVGWSEG